MSNTLSRVARASVLALMVGFAPAASAVGQEAGESDPAAREEAKRPAALTRAAAQAATEMAAPGAVNILVEEAVQAHVDAQEERRVGVAVEAEAAKLQPGKYVWRPEHAQSGPVEIVVNLKTQRAHIFRNRKLIAITTVSTGRKGNVTPIGSFPILQKKRIHHSNLYNNAPMPNMQRMTWDGVALHAGNIPGYAASHGCVRLPAEFSKLLFGVTSIGNVVHVVADAPVSGIALLDHAAHAAARERTSQAALAVAQAARTRRGGGQQVRAR
jgi:lipoprotein-anchoring transpeptidase ErfK/SrfK